MNKEREPSGESVVRLPEVCAHPAFQHPHTGQGGGGSVRVCVWGGRRWGGGATVENKWTNFFSVRTQKTGKC